MGERVCYDVGFWMLVCAGLWGSRGVFPFFLFVFGGFSQLTRGLFIWGGYRSRCARGLVVVVMGVGVVIDVGVSEGYDVGYWILEFFWGFPFFVTRLMWGFHDVGY